MIAATIKARARHCRASTSEVLCRIEVIARGRGALLLVGGLSGSRIAGPEDQCAIVELLEHPILAGWGYDTGGYRPIQLFHQFGALGGVGGVGRCSCSDGISAVTPKPDNSVARAGWRLVAAMGDSLLVAAYCA